MINIQKDKMVNNHPFFSNPKNSPLISRSFTTENSLFSQLKPSKSKTKLIRLFESMIHSITHFFKIERPNSLKENLPQLLHSGSSSFVAPTNISFGQLWSHYQRFLKTDKHSCSQLNSCFNQLEKDESAILSLEKQRPERKEKFIQKHIDDIIKLKEGHSQMFRLQREDLPNGPVNGKLFCIVNKQGENYSIRFVGTTDLMRNLHKETHGISLAGKEKIARELCFNHVPQQILLQDNWLKNFLTSWADNESITPKTILKTSNHLTPYKQEIKDLNDLTTSSDRVDHLFWNVISTFSENDKNQVDKVKTQVENKRVRLRADILTVFDLFQGMRYDLKPHTKDYQLLKQVFQAVATKAHLAYQKGYLSQEELNHLNKELEVIEQTIQTAKKSSTSLPPKISLNKEVIPNLSLENLSIQPKQQTIGLSFSPQLDHRLAGRLPSNEAILIPGLTSIPLNLYGAIQTKEVFLQHFRNIFEKTTHSNPIEQKLARQEMSRLFNEMPYELFIKNKESLKFAKNEQSFWWQFSKNDAQEVMEKINSFSQELVKSKDLSSVSQYEFESYLKLINVVNLLNAHITGYWICDWDVDSSRNFYDNFEGRLPLNNLFNSNQNLNTEEAFSQHFITLKPKDWFIDEENRTAKFKKKDNTIIELSADEQKYVKTQIICWSSFSNLAQSANNFYSLHSMNYAIKNILKKVSWNNWKRPIYNPFLKALYNHAVSSVSYIITKPTKIPRNLFELQEQTGINSPEAFHDNPEGIFNFYLEQSQLTEENPDNNLNKMLHQLDQMSNNILSYAMCDF
jgi:hypothetical protein